MAVGGQAHFHGVLHGRAVHAGQRAGVAKRNYAQVIVGQRAVLILVGRVHFAVREQLRVHFKADDGLVFRFDAFVHT